MSGETSVVQDDRNRVLNINVGILGHVDSGKTSLVKALSTSLSTAALDKHPQSQQRGITLDLGFSAFTLPLPAHLTTVCGAEYDLVQFTLVDCPGHASLIRTIIGGAQIIDMVVLVVDANKGIQTQTAECIVIAEITTDILIVALNKVDMLPPDEREARIEKMKTKIHKALHNSKFANCTIVPISAAVGGEKVAAVLNPEQEHCVPTEGVDALIESVQSSIPFPARNINAPFYFAIDHCFPIRGHGTVITGTVLSGSVSTNQIIEIPHLQLQRKVKSMQMFHKPVKFAKQGDRVGICLTNMDAKLIERSVAASPNSVPHISSAICLLKKIRFFKFPCKSGSKFHITVGHTTVIATVTFFGAAEIGKLFSGKVVDENSHRSDGMLLNTSYQRAFPHIEFHRDDEYLLQDEISETESPTTGTVSENKSPDTPDVQWALLQFQQPVFAPRGSLIIGSRLDVDCKDAANTHQCRLSFFGPIKDVLESEGDINKLGVFVWKDKECEICRITDFHDGYCFEAIGWKLITKGNSIHPFIGKYLLTVSGVVGVIAGAFGADGMFKVKFSHGARIKTGDKIVFRYKRFIFDKTRNMEQPLFDDSVRDERFPDEHTGTKMNPEIVVKHDQKKKPQKVSTNANEIESIQIPLVVAAVETVSLPTAGSVRFGKIESTKESADGEITAVVNGLFGMEENIKLFVHQKVFLANEAIGELLGPFGKLGKCKIKLNSRDAVKVDSTIEMHCDA